MKTRSVYHDLTVHVLTVYALTVCVLAGYVLTSSQIWNPEATSPDSQKKWDAYSLRLYSVAHRRIYLRWVWVSDFYQFFLLSFQFHPSSRTYPASRLCLRHRRSATRSRTRQRLWSQFGDRVKIFSGMTVSCSEICCRRFTSHSLSRTCSESFAWRLPAFLFTFEIAKLDNIRFYWNYKLESYYFRKHANCRAQQTATL